MENLHHKRLIIAHRGASAFAPENTMAAFRLARESGADGIELDAKLSADNQIVVIHDQTLDRTTNGKGKVNSTPYSTIKALDAGSWFADGFHEKVPLLEEVVSELGGQFLINIELTNYSSVNDALPELVGELVKQYRFIDSILFSSFRPRNLLRIRKVIPTCKVGYLTLPGLVGKISAWIYSKLPFDAIHPHYTHVTETFVQYHHSRGRKLYTWTVNDPLVMKKLLKMGVDGIITDNPGLAKQVRESIV